MELLSRHLVLKHLPIIVMSSCGIKLRDKFRAVMYAMWLGASASVGGFMAYVQSVVALTSDMGVEFSLNQVRPVQLRRLFPWLEHGSMAEPAPIAVAPQQGDEGNGNAAPEAAMDPMSAEIGVQHAILVPGPLHIIHNCAKSLLVSLPIYDELIPALTEVCTVLRVRMNRERLCERCFTGDVGKQLHAKLKRFSGKINRDRWGAISHAVEQLIDIMAPLRTFWNLAQFLDGAAGGVEILIANGALGDKQWWGN